MVIKTIDTDLYAYIKDVDIRADYVIEILHKEPEKLKVDDIEKVEGIMTDIKTTIKYINKVWTPSMVCPDCGAPGVVVGHNMRLTCKKCDWDREF